MAKERKAKLENTKLGRKDPTVIFGGSSSGLVQATENLLGHYLFQKTDCTIRRKVGHGVIVSCFGQRNMIYKFFINI